MIAVVALLLAVSVETMMVSAITMIVSTNLVETVASNIINGEEEASGADCG